ncbi:Dual specificity mitogen-activated protein kinase kinase 2 (Fragment), partial [Geodia barretti]
DSALPHAQHARPARCAQSHTYSSPEKKRASFYLTLLSTRSQEPEGTIEASVRPVNVYNPGKMSAKPAQLKKMNLSKQPRLPGLKTPGSATTPTPTKPTNGGDLINSASTPTPPPAASQRALSNPGLAMDELVIKGKKYRFTPDDLEELGPLGAGNYGTVLKMNHKATGTEMAVKKIPVPELRVNQKDNIVELAVVMGTGTCPDIVEYYGCLIREGDVWICMELLDSSMDKISDRVYQQLQSTIPEEILGKMTVSVIRALNYLKTDMKIIHRDVKPSNVLVNCLGQFKLCDFGIAGQLVDSIALTRDVGCRPYMAPERIDPSTAGIGYTIQSDVWSFGITLVELALGSFPYGKWTTIFEQLNAVVNGPAPNLPENDRYSPELREFGAAWYVTCVKATP